MAYIVDRPGFVPCFLFSLQRAMRVSARVAHQMIKGGVAVDSISSELFLSGNIPIYSH